MFNNPFSQNNNSIFNSPFSNNQGDQSLQRLYNEMELLKQKQIPQVQQRTVFSDIRTELEDISVDERAFIENSKEYQEISSKYQSDFFLFLMRKFEGEFINSDFGTAPEQALAVIKKKKEDYKNRFAADINNIREQNSNLAQQNNDLAKANSELQKQLNEIRKQLGANK